MRYFLLLIVWQVNCFSLKTKKQTKNNTFNLSNLYRVALEEEGQPALPHVLLPQSWLSGAVQSGSAADAGSEDHWRAAFLHPRCTGAAQKLHISDTIPVVWHGKLHETSVYFPLILKLLSMHVVFCLHCAFGGVQFCSAWVGDNQADSSGTNQGCRWPQRWEGIPIFQGSWRSALHVQQGVCLHVCLPYGGAHV